jgi:Tfp pilus assembly protein PilN
MRRTKFVIKISDTGFRLVRCAFKKGRWAVCSSENDVLGAGVTDELITEKIGAALKKLKFRNESLVVSLPQKIVALRQFKVPSVEAGEIAEMVNFWALRYMPYPIEEMVTAYSLIKQDEQGYSYVNLNVAHRKDAGRLLKILNPWAKNIEAFVLSSYGLVAAGANLKETPAVIVSIEESCADIIIASGNNLLFGRAAGVSAQDDRLGEKLAEEINKTIKAYYRENIAAGPDKVIVAQTPYNLSSVLKEKTNLPVEELDLAEPALAATLNLSYRFINLLPPEIKENKENTALSAQFGKIAVLFLLSALAVFFSFVVIFYGYHSRLNAFKSEADKIYPEVKELAAIKQKIDALSKKAAQARTLDVLYEVYRIIPAGLALSSLSYEQGREVILRGNAQGLNGVLDSLALFEKSDIFKDAKVNYAAKRKTKDSEIVEFEIIAHLKS